MAARPNEHFMEREAREDHVGPTLYPPSQDLQDAVNVYGLKSPLSPLSDYNFVLPEIVSIDSTPSSPQTLDRATPQTLHSAVGNSGKRLPEPSWQSGKGSSVNQEVPASSPEVGGTCTDLQITPNFSKRNLLLLDKYPGEHEFAVKISPNSKRFPTFSEKLNTLFIHSQTTFAVEFDVCPESLPPNLCIVAMVCYSDATQLAEHGPILPCSCNAHMSNRKPEYGSHFIISTLKKAKYSEKSGHKTVAIKLEDMQILNGKHTAVYSYASYTSCIAKNARIATVFYLMDGMGIVKGRDMFYCNVCACPPRDMAKAENKLIKVKGQTDRSSRKRKCRSTSSVPVSSSPSPSTNAGPSWLLAPPSLGTDSTPPSLSEVIGSDPDISPEPDQDGYYDFRWRVRNKDVFHLMCVIKRNCMRLEGRAFEHSQ